MEQDAVDIAQLEAKIAQLAEEKRIAHDAVASCEYQLDTKRTFTFQTATEEERAWYGKTRYALRKHKQKANDLQMQISKLNATLREEKKMAKKAEHAEEEARRERCFISIAKRKLSPAVFDAILEETIQQVGAL